MTIDRHLAVRHFPKRATVLPRHAHRRVTLCRHGATATLAKARVIEAQGSIAFRLQRLHPCHPLRMERLTVPDHLGQQPLPLLFTRLGHDLGLRFAILVRMLCQQTRQGTLQRHLAFTPFELDLARFQKLGQLREWFPRRSREPEILICLIYR